MSSIYLNPLSYFSTWMYTHGLLIKFKGIVSSWYLNGLNYFQYWNPPLVTAQELTFLFPSIKTFLMSLGIPPNIYLFKINKRNTRKRYERCSKLAIKTPERHYWHYFGVFIFNFELIPHLFLVFLLLNLSMYVFAGIASKIVFKVS